MVQHPTRDMLTNYLHQQSAYAASTVLVAYVTDQLVCNQLECFVCAIVQARVHTNKMRCHLRKRAASSDADVMHDFILSLMTGESSRDSAEA